MGPARKVLSHDRDRHLNGYTVTFYNPAVLHPQFFRLGVAITTNPFPNGVEGSCTVKFSGNGLRLPTPRWDDSQVPYQVDLSNPPFAQAEDKGPPGALNADAVKLVLTRRYQYMCCQ